MRLALEKTITISVNKDMDAITVEDEGRGIPCGKKSRWC